MARSKVEQLPPEILSAVHDALKRGETIDAIVSLIRDMGGEASRSGVGRYAKGFAELAREQRNMRSIAEAFGKEFGTEDDLQTRMMVQLMTSVVTRTIMPIAMGADEDGEQIEIGALELSRLAKAVKDATSAAKIDVEREAKIREEAAKAARAKAAEDADAAGRAAGASEETLSRIRAKILGIEA
ncbi:DUF3486 family protein [Sphingomonas cannabina]|uniref:phage protein Gp27 family protein n=1 Tax=Sphingomonas cannabina TaxID=2899123 RepID=UPI001F32245D|nr:phage protein Gp27 family protein [Sphingomonas cannabina]UIJ46931.1 DUF3486 family protein [Sphingomonas cannabina]